MLQSDVKVGSTYACKVSGKIQPVLITSERTRFCRGFRNAGSQHRKYLIGINQNTERQVETTAGKCRCEVFFESGRWMYNKADRAKLHGAR